MDLLRVELERRPAPDRGPVDGVAVGRRPDARLLAAGDRYSPRSVSRKAWSAGIDDVADDLADPLAVGLGRDLDHRGDDRLVDRHRQHPLDLGDGPLGDDARRGQPGGHPVAEELGVGGHERRVGVQPRDERLEPLGRVGRLELGQLGQQLLRTAHLVDDAQLLEVLVVLLEVELGDDHAACRG